MKSLGLAKRVKGHVLKIDRENRAWVNSLLHKMLTIQMQQR